MTSLLARRLLALAVLACSPLVIAAPPATLVYHGKLDTAAGVPVSSTLDITFRLYDTLSGGTASWEETSSVTVQDGRFAVTLGAAIPLPDVLFANPVFLGIQVAGDQEMTPRLPLSSAPTALRARALLRNTTHVSADGTPQDNAAALRAAVALATIAATSDNRQVVAVDAGEFDLGSTPLVVPPFVDIAGAGPRATLLTGAMLLSVVQMSSDSSLRNAGVLNDGTGGGFGSPNSAIGITDLAQRVVLASVAGVSAPAGIGQGTDVRTGLYLLRASDVLVSDSDFNVARSDALYGVLAEGVWGSEPAGGAIRFEDVRIDVSAVTSYARGFDAAGRMQVSVHGLDVRMRAEGVATLNVIALRTQLEASLLARDLDARIEYAGVAPNEVRGLQFTRSERTDIEGFHLRVDTGTCAPGGFRNAVVFHNPPIAELLPQQQPSMRDGVVELTAQDCFSAGIFSAGSKPQLDNVRVEAVATGAGNHQAIAYLQRDSDSGCQSAPLQDGTTSIRHSSLLASVTESGFAGGVDQCAGSLMIEHSTVSGTHRGFIGTNNALVSYDFGVRNSRLVSTVFEPLALFADATGSVYHTSLESAAGSDVLALADPETAARATVGCFFVNTAAAAVTGPACPCVTAANCAVAP